MDPLPALGTALATGSNEDTGEPAGTEANDFVRGNRHVYLAEGVGIVRVEYTHKSGAIARIELESYSVEPSICAIPKPLIESPFSAKGGCASD